MNLIVDIGNTNVKLAVFEGDTCRWSKVVDAFDAHEWQQIIFEKSLPEAVIVSSTRGEVDLNFIPKGIFTLVFDAKTPVPIQIDYKTPDTLGRDRLAVAVAFQQQFPNTSGLIIDAGTCVTYEYIDKRGVYQGGSISPGLQMRLKAMHEYTGKLPLVEMNDEVIDLVGKTTKEALLSGAVNGMLHEIEATIAEYLSEYGVEKVVITGGDAQHFEKQVKNPIFAAPMLVLEGLNQILKYNVQDL